MSFEEQDTKSKPGKAYYKKRGVRFVLIATALLVLSIILHSSGIQGGIIFALISLGWVACLIIGLFYIIAGFVKKT